MLVENLKIKMRVLEQQRADHASGDYMRERRFSDAMSPAVGTDSPSQKDEGSSKVILPADGKQAKTASLLKLISNLKNDVDLDEGEDSR